MLPRWDDPRWESAAVRPKTRHMSELRTMPREGMSAALMLVYAGDMVSIMRGAYYGEWIAAKVGYKIGWINRRDVDFMLMNVHTERHHYDPDETIPSALMAQLRQMGMDVSNDYDDADQYGDYYDEPEKDEDAGLTKSELTRVIKHLKGIAGIFKGAKQRKRRW